MTPDFINATLFTFHIGLLAAKMFAAYTLTLWFLIMKAPKKDTFMFAFNYRYLLLFLFILCFIGSEIWFLSSFFVGIDLYLYELLAIADEIVFTILAVCYLAKEVKDGSNKK